jgi:hypothetical protein
MNRFRVKNSLGHAVGDHATVTKAFEMGAVPARTFENYRKVYGPTVFVVDDEGKEYGPVLRP